MCAVLAGRAARLRALVPRDDWATIGKHLDDIAHLAKIGQLEQLEEAVRHARDLGAGGRPIAMVIDAIGRAVPALGPGDHQIPIQAVLVNLAPIARAEGATVDAEVDPLILSGAVSVRVASVMADLIGDALDHGSRRLTLSIRADGAHVVAEVRATDTGSTGQLKLPLR
jgi:signal transduction histidine kinase